MRKKTCMQDRLVSYVTVVDVKISTLTAINVPFSRVQDLFVHQ